MLNLTNYLKQISTAWRLALSNRQFALKMVLAPGLFCLYSAATQHLGDYVELRKGVALPDPFLYSFPRFDFSTFIFVLLYASLALTVATHLDKPKIIWRIIEMHFVEAIVRQGCILAVPLEPPRDMILLRDVFLENTVYPQHTPLTKDLFFSGHVASICIYLLCATRRYVKAYLMPATVLMSFMILSMHVHYTYDVYAALLITSAIYYAPAWITKRRDKAVVEITN